MIFLDVGAHEGQTLEEVTKPRYDFDWIYAFEPMPVQYEKLTRYAGHATLLNYGLSDRSGKREVYGDNDRMEASLFPTKTDVDETHVTVCDFIAASEFFRLAIPTGDLAIVKLNCEGGEVAILDDLADNDELDKIQNVMIDFDIRRVAGHEREADRILRKLDGIGFDRYSLCPNVMVGATHQERIAAWLTGLGL